MSKKKILYLSVGIFLLMALVIAGIYLINNKEKVNEKIYEEEKIHEENEKIYENVTIISEDPSNGTPYKIVYNDKEYYILSDDELYSVKFYNGKIYYYKSTILDEFFQEEIEIDSEYFYEFGEIILNEEDKTYSMKLIKKIPYTEYEQGNKGNIEYCLANIDGEYGLEFDDMQDESIIDEIDNITIMSVSENDGYYITYTKTNDKNEIIWTYETEKDMDWGQYYQVEHLDIKNEKIYINEKGTIVALNKDTGKVAFKYKYADPEDMGIPARIDYFDEDANAFVSYGNKIIILNKNGKVKTTIENEFLGHWEGGNTIEKIDNNTYLAVGMGAVLINKNDYSVIETIGIQEFDDEESKDTWAKKDGKGKVIWTYKTNGWLLNDEWLNIIKEERMYFKENNDIVAVNTETGKVIWKNSDYKGDEYDSSIVSCLDSKGNIYLAQTYSPKLFIIDKNGKTVKRLDKLELPNSFTAVNFDDEGMCLDIELSNNESELIITGDIINFGKGKVIINLNDYIAKLEKVNE